MKKVGLVSLIVFIVGLFLNLKAFAFPLYPSYQSIFFRNYEQFLNEDNTYDANGRPTITKGDIMWGVFYAQESLAPTDPTGEVGPIFWQPLQTELTGYFVMEVDSLTTINGVPAIIWKTPSQDPNNILDVDHGEVMKIYEDPAQNFDPMTAGKGLNTATDGTLLWTLTLASSDDGEEGYWYSFASSSIPDSGPVAEAYAGLNFTQDNDKWIAINDPNESFYDRTVEMWFNSEIFVLNDPLQVNAYDLDSPFIFGSNDPSVFHPVPEPATILLLGAGLFSLAAVVRKRTK